MATLRELAERTFDLLILDLNLPDGNGLDLLSRLRDRSALPAPSPGSCQAIRRCR